MDSISTISSRVRLGQLSARSVVEEALAQMSGPGRQLNAVTAVLSERALLQADAVDQAVSQGRDPGPLAGVPFGVKDLFDVEGLATLAGSKIQADSPVAPKDATAIRLLESAGAVLCGTQRMDEYAYGFTTENAHYGATRNPHDRERIAGGSSGGAAACVAAGLLPFSLGTDTNGSVRVPSSLCGIYGLKPTYGRLSRAGAFLFVGSIDCIGPFARSVEDLALVFEAMQGKDAEDPVQSDCSFSAVSNGGKVEEGVLRVGMLDGYFSEMQEPEASEAVAAVASLLGAKDKVSFPDPVAARSAAFVVSACEGGRLHKERLSTRFEDFDPAVRNRLAAGLCAPSSWYLQAQVTRKKLQRELLGLFETHDVLIAPATPLSAPKIGQTEMSIGGKIVPTRPNMGIFTQPISFFGLPVLTVPYLRKGQMPIGVQLIGRPFGEENLFRVARSLEAASEAFRPQIPETFKPKKS
ncbi:AtzE family amidohydrolase [Pelagicoccus albus]|uniref:AtzE family amidohydrolase n=1 Tax=Pelagicoccus albus TaxID=415222 RepID=A0A7X1BBB9_9BACT|nr:AtzE family amidohydrolase [Pelagicoccus albus]MBC2607888.1 AtzE family amidohydrolase [Pelagicoccus albus]